MDTAFIIGNGESRNIFPIEDLKGHGVIYGCNAIYRDYPTLCDNIVAVNPPMYEEIKEWYDKNKPNLKLYGPNDISKWNYILPQDDPFDPPPRNLKLYRTWRGARPPDKDRSEFPGDSIVRTIDFSESRGSGMSAVLVAAETGIKHIVILAFDILGARQWLTQLVASREQNNIYKNTQNYPSRMNMKAYLKYERMFQLRQILRKFTDPKFYFINRKEYLEQNTYLRWYFDQPNIKVGIYADLKRWIGGHRNQINWRKL